MQPGWDPAPGRPGGKRYYDGPGVDAARGRCAGAAFARPPSYALHHPRYTGPTPRVNPPWKGARLGRPAAGSGSLANPGKRLATRLLDVLVLLPLYDAVLTAHSGRTLGKRWMHIRPVRMDGSPLTTGQAFGRAGLYLAAGFASGVFYIGILDPLWCLWDTDHQCVHDKELPNALDESAWSDLAASG